MTNDITVPTDLPLLEVPSQKAWSKWLDKNHETSRGVWLRLGKKNSALTLVTYQQAVEEALCFGWIDGQTRSLDKDSFIQRFTPRGPRSIWSKINVEKVRVLTEAGRMRPAGLAAVERAKANGRWQAAYDGAASVTMHEELRTALDASPTALKAFESASSTVRYAVMVRVQIAHTPEVRARRIASLVGKLERGENILTPAAEAQLTRKPMEWIAFFRAINVGGRSSVPMAKLVELASALGLERPRTVLQTGNLIFESSVKNREELESQIERSSKEQLGLTTEVIAVTLRDLRKAIDSNPFPDVAESDPSHLLLMPMKTAPTRAQVRALEAAIVGRERVAAKGRFVYLHYPDGIGRSKLTTAKIERALGASGTGRNWNTVLKIVGNGE